MYICRLFHRDQPFVQIDARILAEGEISIGRDPEVDWTIDDPDGIVSRLHCTLGIEGHALVLRDRSTNGTFLGDGQRVPRNVPVPLPVREMLRMGGLTLLVDQPYDDPEKDVDRTTCLSRPPEQPSKPATVVPAGPQHIDLLALFCEGAGMDVSLLVGEDPEQVMRCAGEIYRASLDGLKVLLAERARLKAAGVLDRTTIGARENNPIKWASAQRLAQELLCAREDGFLTGAPAIDAAFADIAHHLFASVAGSQAALSAVLDELAPEAIGAAADAKCFSFKRRAAKREEAFAAIHASLTAAGFWQDGTAARAFREAYAAHDVGQP